MFYGLAKNNPTVRLVRSNVFKCPLGRYMFGATYSASSFRFLRRKGDGSGSVSFRRCCFSWCEDY